MPVKAADRYLGLADAARAEPLPANSDARVPDARGSIGMPVKSLSACRRAGCCKSDMKGLRAGLFKRNENIVQNGYVSMLTLPPCRGFRRIEPLR